MWFDRSALKEEARSCMRQSKTSPYIAALVYFLVTFVISELSSRLIFPTELIHVVIDPSAGPQLYVAPEFYSRLYTEPFAYIINFMLELAGMMLAAGMVIFCLHAAKREENSVWNLVDGFALLWKLFLLNLLKSLFTFLWALLLVVPGIIAAYRYRLAIYLLLEHPDRRVMDCIRESKRLMDGRKMELFVLDLSFLGWWLLTIIPFTGVYVIPYMETTYAGYYLAVTGLDSRRCPGDMDGRDTY